ncbi:hypothetical protein CERSUDRAFT_74179 [Gelatoporia subvermispora B]|uniref:Uncharacterized protein n=1 Tax=Ceriporiopsis subvermispora (strain B) TaxID=914234 RepID=M2QJI5_CERS8|nr:hypothetical protein CERSUDRAFT_74179 [Gelatoporia subvermispora B]
MATFHLGVLVLWLGLLRLSLWVLESQPRALWPCVVDSMISVQAGSSSTDRPGLSSEAVSEIELAVAGLCVLVNGVGTGTGQGQREVAKGVQGVAQKSARKLRVLMPGKAINAKNECARAYKMEHLEASHAEFESFWNQEKADKDKIVHWQAIAKAKTSEARNNDAGGNLFAYEQVQEHILRGRGAGKWG